MAGKALGCWKLGYTHLTIPCPACPSLHSTQKHQGGCAGGLLNGHSPKLARRKKPTHYQSWERLSGESWRAPSTRAEPSQMAESGRFLVHSLARAASSQDCTDEQVGYHESKVNICIHTVGAQSSRKKCRQGSSTEIKVSRCQLFPKMASVGQGKCQPSLLGSPDPWESTYERDRPSSTPLP